MFLFYTTKNIPNQFSDKIFISTKEYYFHSLKNYKHFKVNVGCFKILKQLAVCACVCEKVLNYSTYFPKLCFVYIYIHIYAERDSLLLPFQEFSETIISILMSSTTPHC